MLTIAVLAAVAMPSAAAATGEASPTVRPGPGQIAIVDAPPGVDVRVLVGGDAAIADGEVDLAGSLLFRGIEPGSYMVEIGGAGSATTTDVAVPGFDTPPPQQFYDDQGVGPGFGMSPSATAPPSASTSCSPATSTTAPSPRSSSTPRTTPATPPVRASGSRR
jgi:hypothetical protein